MAHKVGRQPIPGYSNRKCYAQELKNCCPEINREHFVSETFLQCIAGKDGKAVAALNLAHQKTPPCRNR
jgi:hypothetical protein